MDLWHEFHGPNAGYILELYERYRADPASVDAATRAAFAGWRPPDEPNGRTPTAAPTTPAEPVDKVMGAVNLATAIREYGHLAARIDPLGLANPPGDPALQPGAHGIDETALRALPATLIGATVANGAANALEAIERLRDTKYATWQWNYGHSPRYNFSRRARTPGGTVEVMLDVVDGVIQEARFYGDYFTRRDPAELASALTGVAHREDDLCRQLTAADADDYFVNISTDDLLGILI